MEKLNKRWRLKNRPIYISKTMLDFLMYYTGKSRNAIKLALYRLWGTAKDFETVKEYLDNLR